MNTNVLKGIDISYWQGKNFKIADHSPDFVIIRGGYGLTPDSCANNYIAQAEALGIPWGVYWYSYALTVKGGTAEAGAALKFLNGRKPPLGVWIDMEDADNFKAKNGFPSNDTITIICREFCAAMKERGLFTGIYASLSWFDTRIRDKKYPRWIAAWGWNDGVHYPDLRGQCIMHQYRGAPLDLDLIWDLSDFDIKPKNGDSAAKNEPEITINVNKIAREVLDGKWGNGLDRKNKLGAWFYSIVQNRVNEIYKKETGKNGTL